MASELDRGEIDALLETAGTGVLSLADDGVAYGVPESFGYDGDDLYFQFVYREGSRKMAALDSTDSANFTVYTTDPARSVVVDGVVEPVPEASTAAASAALAANADIPSVNVLSDRSADEQRMALYRLVPDSVTGRRFETALAAPADD